MDQVRLTFAEGSGWACLRELSGFEEQGVADTSTHEAVRMLDGLLVAAPGALAPGAAAALAASDRDRLLAAVYARSYSPRVESSTRCASCGERFDLDFSLDELVSVVADGAGEGDGGREAPGRGSDGFFRLTDGTRFRLPTGEDECAVAALSPEEAEAALLRRCVPEGEAGGVGQAVQAAMAEAAPLLDLDLDAPCPECGEVQAVHFDIQHFLLTALGRERPRLAREVHRLAAAYGWSLGEILSLARTQRRALVSLVEADLAGSREVFS